MFDKYLKDDNKKYKELDELKIIKYLSKQIEFYERLWHEAFNLACDKHSEAKDKNGDPYILHPKYVSDKFDVLDFKIVAILHDIVEDTDVSLEDLKKLNFPNKIIKAIDAITRRENEAYFDYILRVKNNGIARLVKIEDLKHNLLPERISKIKENESLKQRYEKALKILED